MGRPGGTAVSLREPTALRWIAAVLSVHRPQIDRNAAVAEGIGETQWVLRLLILSLCIVAVCVPAQAIEVAALDIKRLTLEELAEVEVYSASRRLESAQGVPSATFVLTNDDIRRSRVRSIPEALRLVPGVQVARVDANKWAVSIRGFNARRDR